MPREPELIPARMLNEFLYCPRLFHLEAVQGEFEDNYFTEHGRVVHERIDHPTGPMPDPGDAEELTRARSVKLDAPALGMIAVIDIVEGASGRVVPVERKRGRPRRDGGLWSPEELQVIAQALILRENGYDVSEGIVSFPEARRRITVPVTPARIAEVEDALRRLRKTARGPCPPPLVDSPKCPHCSLVGICLPDESRRLAQAEPGPVRRLVPTADDARPLIVNIQGATVRKRAGRLEVTKDGERVASARLIDISHVGVFGAVTITASALKALIDADRQVLHYSYGGWLNAVTTGVGHKNVGLRIAQHETCASPELSLAIARRLVAGKIRNQRTILRRNARDIEQDPLRRLRSLAGRAERAHDVGSLLGFEGDAARVYFGAFPQLLGARARGIGFSMAGRNRRPPRDAVNALLSFGYSHLLRETTSSLVQVGLDQHVGVYHAPRYGRPSLALDLAEEFRPLVADSTVLTVLNTASIQPSDFIVRAGGYALTPAARKRFVAAFERRLDVEVRHPLFGYRVTYRRIIQLQARILAKVFLGELPEYVPFGTR